MDCVLRHTYFWKPQSHLSLQLLYKLQQSSNDIVWDNQLNLLVWLLYMGGAFAPMGAIRSAYMLLLHTNYNTRFSGLFTSWSELLLVLKQFIWSEKAFLSQVKVFWEESITWA
jgi:hypothetical protein